MVYGWNGEVLRYLDTQGELLQPLPEWASEELLRQGYKDMLLARVFDQKCINLQRTGQMGTYASCLGQEAVFAAAGRAMHKDDVLVPYYRDAPSLLVRGVSLVELLLYWGGDERGSDFKGPREDFPINVPIATQTLHAAGVATAFKIRHQKRAVLCNLGDGGTSKGDFMEALNVAGCWQLPVVYLVNNNQWAISVPRSIQCAAPSLALKGVGAGVPGVQVDGNDYISVYRAVSEALAHARAGKGATLIEALSYRLGDHTTADDASRYRSDDEVEAARQKEPIRRLKAYLLEQKAWSEEEEEDWLATCREQVSAAVEEFKALPQQSPESMLEHLFAELPAALAEQYEELRARGRINHVIGEG